MKTAKQLDRRNQQFAQRFLDGWGHSHDFDTKTDYGWTVGEMNYLRHKALFLDNKPGTALDFQDRLQFAKARVY